MYRRWLKQGIRGVIVLGGVIALTSFSIDATDTLRDSNTLLSQLVSSDQAPASCPEGMVMVTASSDAFCIDAYENALTENCPYREAHSVEEAKANTDNPNCQSFSMSGAPVATYISEQFAQTMCAKRGARLPTASEWHEASLGTPDTEVCNTNGSRSLTDAYKECTSLYGVHDMVGNVWEWVAGGVVDGVYDGVTLASEGYVTAVDSTGLPIESAPNPDAQFNSDYIWNKAAGSYAMMRGGYYGSGSDAGLYTTHAQVVASYGSEATGFRCALTP